MWIDIGVSFPVPRRAGKARGVLGSGKADRPETRTVLQLLGGAISAIT